MKAIKYVTFIVALFIIQNAIAQFSYLSANDPEVISWFLRVNSVGFRDGANQNLLVMKYNNDTVYRSNMPYTAEHYVSGKLSLTSDSINYYDSRILGSWFDSSKQVLMIISKAPDGSFRHVEYHYMPQTKKFTYLSHTQLVCQMTNVDSTLFLQMNLGGTPLSSGTLSDDYFFPNKYEFVNDNEIIFSGISLNYGLINPNSHINTAGSGNWQGIMRGQMQQFASSNEYRKWVKSNQLKQDFFAPPIHMYRAQGDIQIFGGPTIKPQNNNTAGLITLAILAGLLLSSGNSGQTQQVPNSSPAMDDWINRKLTGYDNLLNPIYDHSKKESFDNYYNPIKP